MKTLIGWFLNFKIRTKFLISYIFIILFMSFLIGYMVMITSNKVMLKNTQEISQQLISQITENIEYRTNDFEQFSFTFASDSGDSFTSLKEILKKINLKGYDVSANKDLSNIFSKYIASIDEINSLSIRAASGDVRYWFKDNGSLDDASQLELSRQQNFLITYDKLDSALNNTVWTRPKIDGNEVMFGRRIVDTESLDYLGDIVFTVDSSYFRLIKDKNVRSIQEANLAVLNANDEIILADKDSGIWDMTMQVLGSGVVSFNNQSVNMDINGERFLVTAVESTNQKWKVICFVPLSYMLKNVDTLKTAILVVVCVSIIVALAIAYAISHSVSRNISRLEKSMRKIEKGDFSVRVQPSSYDEIGLLGLRFNFMVSKVNELVNTVYTERIAKQQAEFETLQAQINPHFLYNTLGTIRWLANLKKQKEIESLVISLIELLKGAIDKKGNFISLHEEVEYVKNYVLLQKFRYEDRFQTRYDIDENAKNAKVLKLILQPLVENALFHGLDMSKEGGLIKIGALRRDAFIVLTVEDNGVGMTEEQVAAILEDKARKYPGLNSIGVRNVNERIKLYFGPQYGLSYRSELGKGTIVEAVLPFTTGEWEGRTLD
ncbi:sensor histidine kinase [Paenibacillus sinopodophylli]|uniref:sensor histidine kinase n=1 Tax=Paenibacillus sinopodophylli TaxID=1837342 RepID=UPI00110D1D36|nr:sensor histidine kinase [Paenibacillus sinopodophylli]